MNPKLAAAKERRRLALTVPDVQRFEKSLPAIVAAYERFGGACDLRVHNTLKENGEPDAWWEVVPSSAEGVAALNGDDPPSGNESHPCPPFVDC